MKGLAKRNNKTRGKTLRRRKSRGKTARRRKTHGGNDTPQWLTEGNCNNYYKDGTLPPDVDKDMFESACRTELKIPSNIDTINSFFDGNGSFKLNTGGKKRKTHKKRK